MPLPGSDSLKKNSMITATLLLIPSLSNATFILNGITNSQTKIQRERITATSTATNSTGQAITKYIIDVDRNKLAQIEMPPAQSRLFPEIYYYNPSGSNPVAYAYQPESKQYTRSAGKNADLDKFVADATPQVDPILHSFLTEKGFRPLIDKLNQDPKAWRISRKPGQITLEYEWNELVSQFKIDSRTYRVKSFVAGNPTGSIQWDFVYGTYKKPTPPPEIAQTYQVVQFDGMVGHAATPDKQSGNTLQTLYARYEPSQTIAYQSTSDKEKVSVYYSPKRIAQSDSIADWEYESGTLLIFDKASKRYFEGPASSREVIMAVAKTGSRVEVNLRSLLIGRNPFRLMLNDFADVKNAGRASETEPAELITADSPLASMKLSVAKSDGFVLRIIATPKGQNGATLPPSIITFKRQTGQSIKINRPAKRLPVNQLFD